MADGQDQHFGWLDTVVVYGFVGMWAVVVIMPLVVTIVYSFFATAFYSTVYSPTIATWHQLFATQLWVVVVRTAGYALAITLIELIIGFPFALWLAKENTSPRRRALILALLTVPFFLSVTARTIIWVPILDASGLVNTVLVAVGVVNHPLKWLIFSPFAVYLGMLPLYFPTMVLPIFLSISLIGDDLLEASSDLGATWSQSLRYVILPLSVPGILGGILLTIGPALATWVVPKVLGGSFVNLMSNAINEAFGSSNYPIMCALSSCLLILVFGIGVAWWRFSVRWGQRLVGGLLQ